MNDLNMPMRLLFCGNVDDGKSTLIGCLLYERGLVPKDILLDFLPTVKTEHKQNFEFSKLVDGLVEESSQQITIDIGYKYFYSEKRKYIIADAPGHIKYMRNFATAATQSDVAVVLIDAQKGVTPQTLRHAYLCHLFGIRRYIIVINKLDLVNYSQEVFNNISQSFNLQSGFLKNSEISLLPICALEGENILVQSEKMNWYKGSPFSKIIDDVAPPESSMGQKVILVQASLVSPQKVRTYLGTFAGEKMSEFEVIRNLSTNEDIQISDLKLRGTSTKTVVVGGEISFAAQSRNGILRGDVLISEHDKSIFLSKNISARIFWDPLRFPDKNEDVSVKIARRQVMAKIKSYKVVSDVQLTDLNTSGDEKNSHLLDIVLELSELTACSTFSNEKNLGALAILGFDGAVTLGFGIILEQDAEADQKNKNQMTGKTVEAQVLWILGLASAGKSTLAAELRNYLTRRGCRVVVLDADNLRAGLNNDLGFSDQDKLENIRRLAEMAKILFQQGFIVIVSAITPLIESRIKAQEIIGIQNYFEIFLSTPLEECINRDAKGLYKKAFNKEVSNFPGVDGRFDSPAASSFHINNTDMQPAQVAELILNKLTEG